MLRATMDISARSISLADRPRQGQRGHQCSIAPGRPVSISSLPLADLGGKRVECIAATSSAAPHLVSSLVRADGRSFIPACTLDMRRAQARSRPARQGRPQGLALPSRWGCCHPHPSQTRTCRFPASGSSRESFAHGGVAMDDPGCWQRMALEEFIEAVPVEPAPSIPPRQPFLPDPRDLMGVPA